MISTPHSDKTSVIFISVAVCGWIVSLSSFFIPQNQLSVVSIVPTEKIFYHHQFIDLEAQVRMSAEREHLKEQGIPVYIRFNDTIIKGIGGQGIFTMRYNKKRDRWLYRWPCPWNTPAGIYTPLPVNQSRSYTTRQFRIVRRPLRQMPEGFSAMIYETNDNLKTIHPPLLRGGRGNWKNLIDWCEFTGVDALWILGGQTAYFVSPLAPDFPWLEHNLAFLPVLGKEMHDRGLLFGAYVMAYLTFGADNIKPDRYEYAIDYRPRTDTLYETRAISLRDKTRQDDIITMLTLLDEIDEIDFIGLDYIRNALGGYELVDEFVADMDIITPDDWAGYTYEQRMKWLAKKKIARKDMPFIDKWQWWRAHLSASLVELFKKAVNTSKPFWVFTLSWERGWQHGQDPVMMQSAGADIDAVMLYEATTDEFHELIDHWRNYLRRSESNIIIGDVIDWNLHQKTVNPAGPEDYLDRMTQAFEHIYMDGPSRGLFLHDLHRIFWGRRGPYSRLEWSLAGATAISRFRDISRLNCITTRFTVPEHVALHEDFTVPVSFSRETNRVHSSPVYEIFHSAGIVSLVPSTGRIIFDPHDRSDSILSFRAIDRNLLRGSRHYIALRVSWLEKNRKKSYSSISYFNVTGGTMPVHTVADRYFSAGNSMDDYIMLKNDRDRLAPSVIRSTETAGINKQ